MKEEILIKYLLKETNAEEDFEVTSWIGLNKENEEEFNRFKLIWKTSSTLAKAKQQNTDQAWERFKERRDRSENVKIKPIRNSYNWLKIAAVLLIAITATWLYIWQQHAVTTLIANNQVSKEILPDGSELILNKNSIITYTSFGEGERKVTLEKGEVFFNITSDKSKPFIIIANDVKIKVLGTSFNVKHRGQQTEVIVETGLVSVSKKGMEVKLKPGEKVLINANSTQLLKQGGIDQLYRYYRDKEFVADNIPLWRMIEVLNEAYNSNITIDGEKLKNVKLNATFKDKSLEKTLKVISETFHAKIIKKDGEIIIKAD